ncbi:MAG: B12-binding domain-containing radical SAM protein [Pseudodesulfovibrio sp.]|nr:B12-binding domain-containing radical SAM protein [Pseudodesulfovibrio sp.]
MKKNGYDVEILDAPLEPNPFLYIDRICKEKDILAVGFTVKTGPPLLFAMQASYYIKRNYPDIVIMWGGVLPTSMPEEVLRQTFADYVVVGHGEESSLAICNAVRDGKRDIEYPGVCYLKNNELYFTMQGPFSHHHPADWDILGDKINAEQSPYLAALMLSKGCPFRCSFCYHQNTLDLLSPQTQRWFPKPMETVLQEIDTLRARGVNVLTFIDDCTLMNKNRVKLLSKELRSREVYIEQCISHVNTLDSEVIEEIAPFTQQIAYSIETVSPRLQKILNKRVSVDHVKEVDKALARNDVNSIHNFIFGIPSETDEDLRKIIELAVQLRQINPYLRLTGIFCIPYPNSTLEGWLIENRKISITRDLRILSTADMYSRSISPVYQPWITDPDDKQFYEDFYYLFDAVFASWFNSDDERVKSLLKVKRLARLFEPALGLEPVPGKAPYLLDEQLQAPDTPYPLVKKRFLTDRVG